LRVLNESDDNENKCDQNPWNGCFHIREVSKNSRQFVEAFRRKRRFKNWTEHFPARWFEDKTVAETPKVKPTYISLVKFSEKGIRAAKQTTERANAWAAKVQSMGGYDQSDVLDAW
jgi:hypothetical protein